MTTKTAVAEAETSKHLPDRHDMSNEIQSPDEPFPNHIDHNKGADVSFPTNPDGPESWSIRPTDLILDIDLHADPRDKSNHEHEVKEEKEKTEEADGSEKRTDVRVADVDSESLREDNGMSESVDVAPFSRSPSTDESQLLDRTTGSDMIGGLGTFDDHYGFDQEQEFDEVDFFDNESSAFNERLQEMEEEQEQLNSSLIALTSHFAQVQLRLKQIVDADSDEKERLLKELEEFAFRGIPDTRNHSLLDAEKELDTLRGQSLEDDEDRSHKLDRQREKQKELMSKLKIQLEELEKYAYDTGDMNVIPSSLLIERQTVIIEQLKGRLALNLDEMDHLSPEQLRIHVDQALRDLINPVLMKEQLVEQLKTQVTDLERFIEYLQQSSGSGTRSKCTRSDGKCTCDCPLHGNSQTGVDTYNEFVAAERLRQANNSSSSGEKRSQHQKTDSEEAIKMIKRVMTLLNMITFAQFGCNRVSSGRKFERNILKKTSKGCHWGDLRAKLEVAIDHVVTTNKEITSKSCNDSDYTSDSDDNTFIPPSSEKMTSIVRKELASALRDLMEHGLIDQDADSGHVSSLIVSHILDWGCFPSRSSQVSSDQRRRMTAWDLILKYYEIKDGDHFRAAPARRLSQSFNLHIVGGMVITPKQSLLTGIADVIDSHTPFKRSPESHFKAFVSRALNEGKLSSWIRLLVKCRKLVENFYEPWSYTTSTGFDDAIRSLDKLSAIKFDLPTDLAVRQLSNISEAF